MVTKSVTFTSYSYIPDPCTCDMTRREHCKGRDPHTSLAHVWLGYRIKVHQDSSSAFVMTHNKASIVQTKRVIIFTRYLHNVVSIPRGTTKIFSLEKVANRHTKSSPGAYTAQGWVIFILLHHPHRIISCVATRRRIVAIKWATHGEG